MKNQSELLRLIEEQINNIDKYISNISFDDMKVLIKNKELIEQNFSSDKFSFLNDVNLEELRKILPNTPEIESDLLNLSFFASVLNTSYANELVNQPQVTEQIKIILSKIHAILVEKIQQQEELKRNIGAHETTRKNLEKLKNKINFNTGEIDEEDIKMIYSLLSRLNDTSKSVELLISFSEELLRSNSVDTENIVEEEQMLENDDTEEILKIMTSIFEKYNLNFKVFYESLSEPDQKEFISYVKPNVVEEILETLKEFNISLNDSYYNCQLLQHRKNQIKELLIYSSGETIRKVLSLVDKEQIYNDKITELDGTIKKGIDFDLLLESPARFIERKRRYKQRGTNTIDIKFDNDSIGAASDFMQNLELFKSLGVSPAIFCKNVQTSTLPTEKIEKVIKIFELYGINQDIYTKTLSCFRTNHQADSIDQFIELGQFDYVVKNMSRCLLMPDDPIFYRLLYGLKYTNLPIESIITKNGRLGAIVIGKTTQSNQLSFNITPFNKQQMVNQKTYFYGNDKLYQAYDELIDPISSDVEIALSRSDSIVHMLDKHFLVREDNGQITFPNVYNFGTIEITRGKWNINISRNKVLRICSELMKHNIDISNIDTILYIITKNSILTQEEYDIIYDQIQKVMQRGVEK